MDQKVRKRKICIKCISFNLFFFLGGVGGRDMDEIHAQHAKKSQKAKAKKKNKKDDFKF